MGDAAARCGSRASVASGKSCATGSGLRPGDVILYEVDDKIVRLRKLPTVDAGYMRAVEATLSEWDSPEDDEDYAGL